MKTKSVGQWSRALKTRSSLAIIITVAVIIELTSALQFWFAREGIREEVERRAVTERYVKSLEIQNVMNAVESAVGNHLWEAERWLGEPDSLYGVARRIALQNEQIIGGFLAFVPNYYPTQGQWFEPYVRVDAYGNEQISQLAGPDHDYTKKDFYLKPLDSGNSYWSEPYLDAEGARSMVTTYSVPLRDSKGRIVGIIAADVSLEWFGSEINARQLYPSSYNVVISRQGQIIACPVESLVMNRNIVELTAHLSDTSVVRVNRDLMEGKSGKAEVTDEEGALNYVFYGPIGGDSGWSMAVVCADRDIYGKLRLVALQQTLLMLVGMLLLGFIISRIIKGSRQLNKVIVEQERIESDLRIASGIQMDMLPKIFPPFPERDDVDVFGSLVPAREVGGDLYDFHIRDEKLFFAIGDVSGKGVPASLVMAVTRSMFRTVSANEDSPCQIVARINDSMDDVNESNMFVTLFVGVLDLQTGNMCYCNAGHCAPVLLFGAGQEAKLLPVDPNLPVGAITGFCYKEQRTVIDPQTTILLYTDGLTEAENACHEQFGTEKMIEVSRQCAAGQSPQKVVAHLSDAVEAFVGDNEQSDDLTILAVKYLKKQGGEKSL